MAVNSIIFGGVNSADYGIYISGEGVFNAPKRDVEMISIPGRNGAFALDKGRFENIEVTYPAFNFEPDDYASFAQNLSDFRNAISSLRGYQRLTDTFHPDEYRMATYISGLEVKPIKYNTASEFNIVFDCKPQRWLMSGEAAIEVESGTTLLNPTMFESSPMLEVEGYGALGFNGYRIEFEEGDLGNINITADKTPFIWNLNLPYSLASLNEGDSITVPLKYGVTMTGPYAPTDITVSDDNNIFSSSFQLVQESANKFYIKVITEANIVYTKSANDFSISDKIQLHADFNGNSLSFIYGCDITAAASGGISIKFHGYSRPDPAVYYWDYSRQNSISELGKITAYSTLPLTGAIRYIDCDLGEAYMIRDGEIISLNQYVDLGSELPTLAVGTTEITFDNTITDLKVAPRWWKV